MSTKMPPFDFPLGTARGLKSGAGTSMLHAQADLRATLEASVFFTETQQQLMSAKTSAELEVAARALDTKAFEDLPYEAREDLGALYAHRLYHITGAFLG